jgi:hypothetical protein
MSSPDPRIAVLIPSVSGWSLLEECLETLAPQACAGDVEVIVADRCGDEVRSRIPGRFPWVTVLAGAEHETIPELRDRAIRHSRAPVVAVIEDHCMVGDGWLNEARAAHAELPDDSFAAVGGPVENGAVDRLRDWAAFLCEYSHAMGPMAAGETPGIPGNNVAYRRSALDVLEAERASQWEYFLHARLRRAGYRFLLRPSMVVHHKRPFGFAEYVQQRFLYSRSFAAMRAAGTGRTRRWMLALVSLALPPLLMVRISRQVLGKRRHVGKLIASLPLLAVFTTSWAAGEIAGYLFGAGRSLERVK